jgi:competence protein ComEC
VWHQWGYLQWAIALGMLPLTLALFQRASLVAPVANMLAVPVFDLAAVPLTLAGVVALAVLPETFAQWPLAAAAGLLQLLWPVLDWLAAREYAQWLAPSASPWALFCALVGAGWLLAPRGVPARWVGIVWWAPLLSSTPAAPAMNEAWLSLLDVGQGLAAVVRTQNHVLVYDTGPRFGRSFDTGDTVVVPYLRAQGVRRIDTLIISHGDNDHIGGTGSVLRAMPVQKTLSSVPWLLADASACEAGQSWEWDGVEFTVLGPPPGAHGRRNDASCVLRVASRYGTVLLPGDIEARAERELLARAPEKLAADILVAPHHGSLTSSSCAFLATVRPRYVLFPVGNRNRHQHPHARVRARYELVGARQYDSPAAGALEARLGARGIEIDAYRERARRYWFAD